MTTHNIYITFKLVSHTEYVGSHEQVNNRQLILHSINTTQQTSHCTLITNVSEKKNTTSYTYNTMQKLGVRKAQNFNKKKNLSLKQVPVEGIADLHVCRGMASNRRAQLISQLQGRKGGKPKRVHHINFMVHVSSMCSCKHAN